MNRKKILMIGGGGFIGINILKKLEKTRQLGDYDIILLGRSCKPLHLENCNLFYIQDDYMNPITLRNLFKRHKFEKVLHLASNSVPSTSNLNIYSDAQVNLMSTMKLLEMMVEFNCLSIVFLSSGGALYGESLKEPFTELDSCKPISSYGIIKWTIERYLELFQKIHQLNYLILRISNAYGPYHSSHDQGIINIAIRKAINGETIKIWGNGSQAKDYIYSEDLADIIISLIQSNIENEIVNIGYGQSFTLKYILNIIHNLIPSANFEFLPAKISDISNFSLNINKLTAISPLNLHSLDDGIYKTFEWCKSNKQ